MTILGSCDLFWAVVKTDLGSCNLSQKLIIINDQIQNSCALIAKENDLKVCKLPKIFTIRWSEFSFTLLRNILISWKALVLYFGRYSKDDDCMGYLRYLTKLENLELIAFVGDVLFSFKRFQKKIQSDRLTIISLKSHITSLTKSLPC